jgi:hypothetical protein
MRIGRFNKPNFFAPSPTFKLLFAIDCFLYLIERFPIEQPLDIVLVSKALNTMKFVIEYATMEIASHHYLERAGEDK